MSTINLSAIVMNGRGVYRMLRFVTFILIASFSFMLIGCAGSTRKVSRVAVDQSADLSGRWNDTDSRMTAETMVRDVLSKPWLSDFKEENGRKPVVVVGTISNRSSEHIETRMLVKDIERELVNSGQITFVASDKQRQEVRQERMDQQSYSSIESAKELANEVGADFMLQGIITSVTDSYEGEKVIYYQIDMELINVESNEKVWIGNKKIKKFVEQSKYKW